MLSAPTVKLLDQLKAAQPLNLKEAIMAKQAENVLAGKTDAMNDLGLHLVTISDYAKIGIELLHVSASRGNVLGKFNYGRCLFKGLGIEKNEVQGASYIDMAMKEATKLASDSDENAQNALGFMRLAFQALITKRMAPDAEMTDAPTFTPARKEHKAKEKTKDKSSESLNIDGYRTVRQKQSNRDNRFKPY